MYKRRAIKFRRIFQRRLLINVLSLAITRRVRFRKYYVVLIMRDFDAITRFISVKNMTFLVLTASGHNRPEEFGQFLLHEQHHSVPEQHDASSEILHRQLIRR